MLEELRKELKREFGISTNEELAEYMKNFEGVDLGIFVAKDQEGQSASA